MKCCNKNNNSTPTVTEPTNEAVVESATSECDTRAICDFPIRPIGLQSHHCHRSCKKECDYQSTRMTEYAYFRLTKQTLGTSSFGLHPVLENGGGITLSDENHVILPSGVFEITYCGGGTVTLQGTPFVVNVFCGECANDFEAAYASAGVAGTQTGFSSTFVLRVSENASLSFRGRTAQTLTEAFFSVYVKRLQ